MCEIEVEAKIDVGVIWV